MSSAPSPCHECVLMEKLMVEASQEVDRLSTVCRVATARSEEHRQTTEALARARQKGREAVREYQEHKKRHRFG